MTLNPRPFLDVYGIHSLKRILLIACIIIHLQGYSQHRIGDFMAYGNNNGLPAALFYSVFQSSDGYLWIGSSSGLVRFDGKRYKIFFSNYADTNSISDNIIDDLVEDDHQNLWIGGFYQGVSKYNLKTGDVQRYSRLSPDSTPGYGINKLMKDADGGIWAATAGRGLAHYIPALDSFEMFIPDPLKPADGSDRLSNHVSDIAIDHSDKNIFWLSCFDGLYSFDRKQNKFERFVFYNPEDRTLPINFLSVETAPGNIIWLGTWYNGLMSFDKKTQEFKTYTYAKADPPHSNHYQVLDIQALNDTTLYLASRDAGLLTFHTVTQKMSALLTNEMLPGGSSGIDIQQISITPDAGVFIGGNYYIYQQHASFNRFSSSILFPYGPDFNVQQIIYDDYRKGYWMGSLNGGEVNFFSKDMAGRQMFKAEDQTEFQCIDLAIDSKQRVWAVSPFSGLLEFRDENNMFRQVEHTIPGIDSIATHITCIESDVDGNLWLMTRKKLYFFDVAGNTFEGFNLLPDNNTSLYQLGLLMGQNGEVWIASDRGLFHYVRNKNKVIHLVPDETTHKGMANLLIKSMTVDKAGNAWLGFESDGVQVISGKDHSVLSTYNLDDGLPGMQINYMTTDSAGRIWVGTSAGLALFNPAAESNVWQLFNREDGIKRDYIDRPVMATEDGKLFFNIEEGISWIDIGADTSFRDQKPLLHLISIEVDGKPYRDEILPDYLTTVDLSHATKEIRIDFAAMDWLHPDRTKYFYRIDGINPAGEWIENNQATLLLTGMKPGTYFFRLYAVNGEGIHSEEIGLPIHIRPAFWQRWWFIALCIIGVLFIAYGIYRYRIGQLKKLQAMRNTISTNLHDDIGASLSNIHILTVLTQRNISNKESATSYITKAGEEIQRISESLSDIVWNISPKYDDLDNLFIRMKRYAADMLEGKNIKAELLFPDEAEKISMPMDQRRDFYLIFKEAVNNLVKYSGATEASVRIGINNRIIRLEVSDNGKGFEEQNLIRGNGIMNMKQRAEKWNVDLIVNSVPNKGTMISLEMKVN